MTLKDWEELVRNRPKPDTPGFYKLIRFHSRSEEYEKHEVESVNLSNDEKFSGWQWRFRMEPDSEQEYEYYPTFEEAHEAMMNPSEIADAVISPYNPGKAVGYRITHLGFGPHGTRDFYIDYRQYDADRREYMRSSCSSYHWNTPGIFGRFLGRLPEDIPFKMGDIVEITGSRQDDGNISYATLGVIIGEPITVADTYKWPEYREGVKKLLDKGESLDRLFEEPDGSGADEDEYFVLYGPFDESLRYATFTAPEGVRPPSLPVPDEAREYIIENYRKYLKSLEND